jgi:hypothetical protein
MSFSKDDFHIIDHMEYILTGSVARLGQVVCRPFKMLAFLSYGVICRKKSTVAKVHDLSKFLQEDASNIIKAVCACIISLV